MGAGGFWSGVVRRRTLSAERELGVIGPLCDETICSCELRHVLTTISIIVVVWGSFKDYSSTYINELMETVRFETLATFQLLWQARSR